MKRSADRIVSLHGDVGTPRHIFDASDDSETTFKMFYMNSSVVAYWERQCYSRNHEHPPVADSFLWPSSFL